MFSSLKTKIVAVYIVIDEYVSLLFMTPEQHIIAGATDDPEDIANRKRLLKYVRQIPYY